jgi:UPF0271 protein
VGLRIDLNADVGESFGVFCLGDDEALLEHVTSANVACGFHAGDPSVMDRTVRLAVRAGVAVGAHPGFPDLRGFGRREIAALPDDVEADVLYQSGALAAFVRSHGARLAHVKPHGALYNQAARDEALARAVARGVARLGKNVALVGLAGSDVLQASARAEGLRFVAEAFVDRGYDDEGRLLPRGRPGALVDDPLQAAERALRLAREGVVLSAEGRAVEVRADTLCLHGDGRNAVAIARAVREALEGGGVRVEAPAP